uniref:Uncharacterized protein n=1 Tax=Manihot esculenta TaxID=3983 RepID=A0A251IR96_MANES
MNNKDQLDVKEIAMSIRDDLANLQPLSDNCCIYRAPKRAQKLHEKLYTPRVVSIGPLHHGKEELKAMEEHKRRYLFDFLQLSNSSNGVSLESYITCIEKNEGKVRNCYAETIELESEKFVKMMLLDATFIIMLLVKHHVSQLQSSNDRIYRIHKKIYDIRHDIILLENLVPFFILEELFQLSNIAGSVGGLSMIELTHRFFQGRWDSWVTKDILKENDFSQVKHFLDFLRICQRPQRPKQLKEIEKLMIPTATELYHAGVKFELHPSGNKLDIEFDNGILKIPHFRIEKEVEILLRNLQTYEDCHCDPGDMHINDYIVLIGKLLKSGKDVEILDESGMIENWMQNNEAAATLFCNMDCTADPENFYFSKVVDDLNSYEKSTWHKWIANLKQNYFNTPWAGISVAAAVILLVLTLMQTVCSFLQLAKA